MAQQRHLSEARGANPKVISGADFYPVARDHSPDTKEWIKVALLPWFFSPLNLAPAFGLDLCVSSLWQLNKSESKPFGLLVETTAIQVVKTRYVSRGRVLSLLQPSFSLASAALAFLASFFLLFFAAFLSSPDFFCPSFLGHLLGCSLRWVFYG